MNKDYTGQFKPNLDTLAKPRVLGSVFVFNFIWASHNIWIQIHIRIITTLEDIQMERAGLELVGSFQMV